MLFSKNFRIQPLCEDKKGNVWISTSSGLACYNRYSGEKYLVPEITQLITRAYEDKNGNIIALSADGLWFYNPVKKIARNFNEQDGIRLNILKMIISQKEFAYSMIPFSSATPTAFL